MNKLFKWLGVKRLDRGFRFKWIKILLEPGFEFRVALTPNPKIRICLIYGLLEIALPFKIKLDIIDNDSPWYGFVKMNNSICFEYGRKLSKDGKSYSSRCKFWKLPFITYFLDKTYYLSNSKEWVEPEINNDLYSERYTINNSMNEKDNVCLSVICRRKKTIIYPKWLPFLKEKCNFISVTPTSDQTPTYDYVYKLLNGESIEQCLRRVERTLGFDYPITN